MNKLIWLLTILTCILFYFLGQRSVVIPKCEPMTEVKVWLVKEPDSCTLRTRRDCKTLDHDLPLNQK
jgi:hypothetical protein